MLLGFDIGGTKSAVVVGSPDGQILDRIQFRSQAERGPLPMIDDLFAAADRLQPSHGPFGSAGVSIGGPLDANQGIIHEPPNLPGWKAIPLRAILQKHLHIPVRIEHDAAACALAEYHWGAGRNAGRLIYLTCGTGFGAGLVFDGIVYRGTGGKSVEIGHTRMRDDGPIAFGKRGSVEAFCAASALPRIAHWRFPNRWPSAINSVDIVRDANLGMIEAIEVLRINANAVGDVCAMLGDLLRPDVIVLGSSARYFGDDWLRQVRARFTEQVLPDTNADCQIVPAALGDRLQDCSALAVAMDAKLAD
ncbi:MAG: ROK family protein [Phycisphaerae bacterium]|nr:ROK family protein [Phycisphaerae bacterium]